MQDFGTLIFIAALAGIIGFLLFYFRDYIPIFQKGVSKTAVDQQIEGLLDNIRKLAREHQYKKAGLLVWNTFSVAADGFLGIVRILFQTARAFVISMLVHDEITQETVEPVYQLFEKARYSNSDVTLQEFNSGLTGLHRFLQVANKLSAAAQGGEQEGTSPDVAVAGSPDEDDDF